MFTIALAVELVIIAACFAAGADASTPHKAAGGDAPITIAAMALVGLPVTIGLGALSVALWVEDDELEDKKEDAR